MSLLAKELKITFTSLTYWVVVMFLGVFLYSQIGTDMTPLKKPEPNQESYGIAPTKDKEQIQAQTYGNLLTEYSFESFTTYPFGFSKDVRLSDSEQDQVRKILENASGKSIDELQKLFEEYSKKLQTSTAPDVFAIPLAEGHSYQKFEEDMEKVSSLLGKGSSYEKDWYLSSASKKMTYEDAKKEFESIVRKDHVTGAYARIICDYLGIILAVVPVFIGATVLLRDRRSKSQGVICTRSLSSARLIGTRYFSAVLLMLIPVLLFCINPALQAMFSADKIGASGDLLLFFEYIAGWTLPTILAVLGISFLITELFGGIAAVVVQIGLFFWQLSAVGMNLVGAVGFNLIPRFNTVGSRTVFEDIFRQLVVNRVFWSGVGMICLLLTIFIYDFKRKGGRLFGKNS